MTTNLLTTGNVDFDNCFEKGSGNQLLYIYAQDGTDIGQKYYNVSEGSAYGTTGMLASSGTDVGNLLCKAGTRDDGSVVVTCGAVSGAFKGYYYGYVYGSVGSVNRRPYWVVNGTKCYLTKVAYYYKRGDDTDLSIEGPRSGNANDYAAVTKIAVNGVTFTRTYVEGDEESDPYYTYSSVSGNPLGLSSGAKVTLKFTPAPDGFN